MLCEAGALAAAAPASREAQMKAAYVFNFVKFIDWPQAPDEAISICFVGAEEVRNALADSTAEKKVAGRSIAVRSLMSAKDSAEQCNVLYFDSSEGARHTALASMVGALTIGDAGDFTRAGGVIRLYMESNRLRFTVNVENAKRSGLQVSSNLLKLATRVEQEGVP